MSNEFQSSNVIQTRKNEKTILVLQRIFSVIPVKTGIQHVYGL